MRAIASGFFEGLVSGIIASAVVGAVYVTFAEAHYRLLPFAWISVSVPSGGAIGACLAFTHPQLAKSWKTRFAEWLTLIGVIMGATAYATSVTTDLISDRLELDHGVQFEHLLWIASLYVVIMVGFVSRRSDLYLFRSSAQIIRTVALLGIPIVAAYFITIPQHTGKIRLARAVTAYCPNRKRWDPKTHTCRSSSVESGGSEPPPYRNGSAVWKRRWGSTRSAPPNEAANGDWE